MLTVLYIINASLLLSMKIESAYIKEWEILKLPGKITGFLLLHIPSCCSLLGRNRTRQNKHHREIIALIAGAGD